MRLPWGKKQADAAPESNSAAPPAEIPQDDAQPASEPAAGNGWFTRLRQGLSRSASALSDGVTGIFTRARLDSATLSELEDLLIQSDLGVDIAADVTSALGRERLNRDISASEVRAFLATHIETILRPAAIPLTIDAMKKPFVILVAGVNGTGKTTTIGKLAHLLGAQGHSVMLAAGDTFRAAAIEQLQIWGQRAGAQVIAGQQGTDASGLVFEALGQARAAQADVLLIDTAGRLQNKTGLMEELRKINRVLAKQDETAPHAVLLVLDATTGQNAISQVETFREVAKVTGLVMTKLDGTARGGILVALVRKFGLPVHAIGIGEGMEDLRPFDASQFARALTGIPDL